MDLVVGQLWRFGKLKVEIGSSSGWPVDESAGQIVESMRIRKFENVAIGRAFLDEGVCCRSGGCDLAVASTVSGGGRKVPFYHILCVWRRSCHFCGLAGFLGQGNRSFIFEFALNLFLRGASGYGD